MRGANDVPSKDVAKRRHVSSPPNSLANKPHSHDPSLLSNGLPPLILTHSRDEPKIPIAEHTKHTLLPSTVAKFYGHNMFMCQFIHHESYTHLTGVEREVALRLAINLPG